MHEPSLMISIVIIAILWVCGYMTQRTVVVRYEQDGTLSSVNGKLDFRWSVVALLIWIGSLLIAIAETPDITALLFVGGIFAYAVSPFYKAFKVQPPF